MLYGYKIAALCISRVHEEVLRQFIESFAQALEPCGWRVMIFATGSDLYHKTRSNLGEETIFDLIDPEIADALLVFGDKILDPECFERIVRFGQTNALPTFVLNGQHEGCCCLNFDFETGFADVVRHLVEHHQIRDFHFIAGMKDNDFSDARIAVMRSVMEEYGIPFGQDDISYGDFWSVPAQEAVRRLIAENRLPRAIVCANDSMAIAASAELQHQGYDVPEDVVVTGFDGVDEIKFSIPRMTSAACDYRELGREAARLCVESGNGEPFPEEVTVIPSLILQESCGCVRKRDRDMVDYITAKNNSFFRYQNEDEKLSEISARIQSSNTLEEVSTQLHDGIFYSMQGMIKKEFIDFSLDPTVQHSASTFGEELYVIMDTNVSANEGTMIPVKQMILRMEEMIATGHPLVFTALHNIELPIGYLCYTYQDCDAMNYLKINQNAIFLGTALAGFRNRRYQQHLQSVVEAMYKYDALTGLYTRSAFLKQLAQYRIGDGTETAVVVVDLDGLKYINDHYSHSEGDNAIATVANAMHNICRDGLCCRYGGDEMVALLPRGADPADMKVQLQRELDNYNANANKSYPVSASIGVCSGTDEDFDTMFAKADALMYQDKLQKPNRRK